MINLKADASYIRFYRDSQSRWVTGLGALKAIASSTGIAAWVVWREYAFVWAAIIAAAQVADALKDVFPFAKKHKAASEHTATLDSLFIDAQLEWENIFSGKYTDDEIKMRLHRLRKLQLDAETRNFPDGLAERKALLARAKEAANTLFLATYGGQTDGPKAASAEDSKVRSAESTLLDLYFLLQSHIDLLLGSASTQEERDALAAQYAASREAYWASVNRDFPSDSQVGSLAAQLVAATNQLKMEIQNLSSAAVVISKISEAVSIASRLASLASPPISRGRILPSTEISIQMPRGPAIPAERPRNQPQ
jgi:hypothetical protein